MKDVRKGQSLWQLWDGYEQDNSGLLYYTEDHVSLDEDVVKRALASSIQRDGIVSSLGESFRILDPAAEIWAWMGYVGENRLPTMCYASGETESGEVVNAVIPITLVEIPE